jgi:hypothetical protein
MIAVQALEKRTAELKQKEAQLVVLESMVEELKAKHAYFETVAARLEALELRNNPSIQITAEKSLSLLLQGSSKFESLQCNHAQMKQRLR